MENIFFTFFPENIFFAQKDAKRNFFGIGRKREGRDFCV